jgi:hypothetical protein
MFKGIMNYLIIGIVAIFGFSSAAYAGEEPIEMLVKFKIEGHPSEKNTGAFTVGGPGYAAITTGSGEILDTVAPGLEIATLSGAEIAFIPDPDDPDGNPMNDYPVINFTCLSSTCTITFKDGSVLESVPDVPLSGRLATVWGPIGNSDLNANTTPMRILGCGGLRETAGKGKFAGMVGSICFNGVFNVPDFQTNFTLTGGSNCTITLHTPVVTLPY